MTILLAVLMITKIISPEDNTKLINSLPDGSRIILSEGDYGPINISGRWERGITVDARRARLKGLVISGSGISLLGGTYSATGGKQAKGGAGYGIKIVGSRIKISGATITDAKKAVVLDSASDVSISESRFVRYGEDGIIASATKSLKIKRNYFGQIESIKSKCLNGAELEYGLSRKICLSKGGFWTDGNHADAIQLRNGIVDADISENIIEGDTQGIAQMDNAYDLPMRNVTISKNFVTASGHHITLDRCDDCKIENNVVKRWPEKSFRAVIRNGKAERCGNSAQDEKADRKCAAH